jgi:hypothetical protein
MAKRNDAGATLLNTTGQATWWGNGFWQHAWYVRDALCEDGRRRTVRLNQQADTYFSWAGRTTIGGKSVRGFVSGDDKETTFIAFKYES